ncbi:hypothetical protein PPL_02898 [Heterostelium album PN500]|uniref:Heparan-alpha-glucosaminide N-acetyltransferase catalytic domain-containing protein n=1 Tax=Heterostelium pallidum (strain ATCC 26659 / Pp 5 / PN500) TaxID=670386 RepID=D3B3D2_HETP5|nr:hypothetical protein PPL_02898 [Heterostelium album PN500]EFA83830.1 hypothetical protein PPL_02898 [Heterostelium album PN500]|eukprot:XP_020435947.1 hypothetical protein PPL_02898 [Heterostelium album PN500]
MKVDEETPLVKGSTITSDTSINVDVDKDTTSKPPPKKRMLSLDTARGLTIFGMILVDNQGGPEVIWPLKETDWNGISTADLIFPSFLFICGFSISLALKNAKNDRPTWINIIRRTILLFGIQLFLNLMAHKFVFSTFRVMGVLQRISLCYCFSCCSFMLLPKWAQRVALVISATIYLCLMYAYPVPGCGRGNITRSCNAAGYIDNLILRKNMIHPTDPEGFISTFSAFITTWMGVELGRILTTHARSADGWKDILIRWLSIGMVCAMIGLFLDATNVIQFNKIIWSFSFAMLTVACGALFLSALYYSMDVAKWPETVRHYIEIAAQPFIWIGTNPITIYTLMIFIEIILMFYITVDHGSTTLWTACYEKMYLTWLRNGYLASTVFSIMWFVFFDAIAYLMYRNNIIIKL